jgi:hypothetical protein
MGASLVCSSSASGIGVKFDRLTLVLVLEPLRVDVVLSDVWAGVELIGALVEDSTLVVDGEAIRRLLPLIALELTRGIVVNRDDTAASCAIEDSAVLVAIGGWGIAAVDAVLAILELSHHTIHASRRSNLETTSPCFSVENGCGCDSSKSCCAIEFIHEQ